MILPREKKKQVFIILRANPNGEAEVVKIVLSPNCISPDKRT